MFSSVGSLKQGNNECTMSILLLGVHYWVYPPSIVFSYIALSSAGFLSKNHVVNHHISADHIMNCFHKLPFVSFRWWRFINFGLGKQ